MRVLRSTAGAWTEAPGLSVEAARELVASPTHLWIRLEGMDGTDLERVGAAFGLHPLAIEDVRNPRQRPKVEEYPGSTFVVVRVPRWPSPTQPGSGPVPLDAALEWLTVGLFLGPDFLVTASTHQVAELDQAQARLTSARSARTATVDQAFYTVVDTVVDSYFPMLDELEDRLEGLEEGALASPEQHELRAIMDLKRLVIRIRKTVSPMREAMARLETGDSPNVRAETRLYLRDVADHMTRLSERLEHVHDAATLALDTYNAALQNQTNRTVKLLTGITLVATVPMLVGTMLGMNLQRLPQWGFWPTTLVSLLAMVPMYLIARRLDWI